ncbi:hypothetical protein CAOG_02851 [Capsaspora owczarzaki ATCC 30864]|uniref:IST1 homolog n=1 Tax=Capsaspora owczarzaki (strain ATCC 30864) TaxID=595528 RepID=A0A0D2WM08_CAPO3|nr:hypothetical protein CAOG_02851 [Capsaspora owczarzaki ATCC 30864]KJE91760.1 hypothetical protein CAOG_002851 [Capsaspora owczarzaki ATCC 30864]|eukprot:XP_004348664.2 hypothetical protein CAOG_02851 [Capsaspora owczarzaki ATCC 30864]
MGFNGTRLKVQLKLAVNRLKMLQNKKANQNAVARKQIGALLDKGKEESARIKVEHIIREDYMIEAMELIELYCDLLLARYGIIEQMKYCDDGIREAVNTIIWVAPRLTTEVQELTLIREQLIAKYGKEFGMAAMETQGVSDRVMRKFSVQAPEQFLVTQYLIEIARALKINWVPPAQDVLLAPLDSPQLIGPPPLISGEVITLGSPTGHSNGNNSNNNNPNNNNFFGGGGGGGIGAGGFIVPQQGNPYPAPQNAPYPPMAGQNQAPYQHQQQQYTAGYGGGASSSSSAPAPYKDGNTAAFSQNDYSSIPPRSAPAPDYPGYPGSQTPAFPSVPGNGSPSFNTVDIPAFPSVPGTLPGDGRGPSGGSGSNAKGGNSAPAAPRNDEDDPDFDDLARRFMALKKRT